MDNAKLSEANTRSRLRMNTLYYYAGLYDLLVAGTGNKVEDFGIGFFTKYGDGGVDISPIGDLLKSDVKKLSQHLNISLDIINATPTDGLWDNGSTDEDQIGATYDELEWAMMECEKYNSHSIQTLCVDNIDINDELKYSKREYEVLVIYIRRHNKNQHKMNPIPICNIPIEFKF